MDDAEIKTKYSQPQKTNHEEEAHFCLFPILMFGSVAL